MKLIKRFSYQEFLSDNKCVCAPTILDGLIVYRDGRPCNPICDPINEYKVLKIGKIDQNLNVSQCRPLDLPGKIMSDPRLFKWKGKPYIAVTIIEHDQINGYHSTMDVYDLETNQLLNIRYDKSSIREKNWIFFQDPYSEDLLVSYFIANGQHKVLKLRDNKLVDHSLSSYSSRWSINVGKMDYGVKNTSNLFHHDGLFWGALHSHDGITYSMGFYAFEDKMPYKIVKMSNVPFFKTKKADIFWPSHLTINDDKMETAIGFFAFDYFDLISISMDEINNHFEKNITYNYSEVITKIALLKQKMGERNV